jgi:hypothetical protein
MSQLLSGPTLNFPDGDIVCADDNCGTKPTSKTTGRIFNATNSLIFDSASSTRCAVATPRKMLDELASCPLTAQPSSKRQASKRFSQMSDLSLKAQGSNLSLPSDDTLKSSLTAADGGRSGSATLLHRSRKIRLGCPTQDQAPDAGSAFRSN